MRLRDDDGAVAVIVAIMITALIGFAALAVDVGYMYDTRHQLQAAADAAALAGCDVLIETADPGAADAAAREYALRNENGAATGLAVASVEVNDSAEPWFVRVRVTRQNPAWFAGIFGSTGTEIDAEAKAEKARLTGARYLMPWAIPTIEDDDIDRVEASFTQDKTTASGPSVLGFDGPRRWSGSLAAPSTPGGYDLSINIFNVWGVREWVGDSKGEQPAARLIVDSDDYPFSSVSMNKDYLPSDAPESVTIDVTTKKPAADGVGLSIGGGGKTKAMDGAGTSWSYIVNSGDLDAGDGFLETTPLDVTLGKGKADGLVDAYLHVRRSTYPVIDAWLDSTVVSPGATVPVHLTLNDFDPAELVPGRIYELRVGSAGVETGNFGEVNYAGIRHDLGSCPADPAGVPLGNNVKDWVADGYGGGVHIGDIIPLSPGKSGWTPNVLAQRIAEYGDIVVLPVVAKFEDKSGGAYDVIVRRFAAFRIVSFGNSGGEKGVVEGEFVEYLSTPSEYEDPGTGGGGTVFAARLVNP